MEKKANVLLVDDELDFLRTIVTWLKSIGYTVSIALSGEDALQRLKGSNLPDIIFLDIDMPEMSGLETLGKIREFNKELPILMMIKDSKEEKRFVAARNLGISGFFAKNETFDEFVKILEKTLQVHRQYRPYSN
ncbi:MAG: response regulator [Candidatus Omnitrophota bacterium]